MQTSVPKCLENELLIFGLETAEVLVLLVLSTALNFLFGHTHLRLLLIWLPVALLAVTFYVARRGKPPNYLQHYVYYSVLPKQIDAF